MTIRAATTDDVTGIRAVARDSWEADYPDTLSRESGDSGFDDWYGPDRIERAVTADETLVRVAEADSQVVGFAHATVTDGTGVILRLYVHPDHRRGGRGRALFFETSADLADHDIDGLRAMALAANDQAQEFYEDLGFDRVDSAETTIGDESVTEYTFERPPAQ